MLSALPLVVALLLVAPAIGCSYDYEGAIRCDNGDEDGDETDVDCGGSCVSGDEGRCAFGQGCRSDVDCNQHVATCVLERCTPEKLTAHWRKVDTPSGLQPRFGAGFSFTTTEGVLTGGYSKVKNGPPATSLDDSWVFDGTWRKDLMDEPSGRHYHAQTYDTSLDRVVIAGGESVGGGRLKDAWARDANSQWTKLAPLPESRVTAAMVYDRGRSRALLYGEGAMDEVWVLPSKEGATWQRLKTVDPPAVPFRHAMTYDELRAEVIVFGGITDASTYKPIQRTSILDAATLEWKTHEQSNGPRARWGAGMAYDSHRKRAVLFGGRASQGRSSSAYNDAWDWDGERWIKLAELEGQPLPPRSFHPAFAYRADGREMVVLAGGTAGFFAVSPAQTWAMAVLGWPCASDLECGEGTFCVDKLCCNSPCEDGVCNDLNHPGVCTKTP